MNKICCFTGHRRIHNRYVGEIYRLLKQHISELYEKGFSEFRSGGALGFDTLAALAVLELKQELPDIKLHLILPCKDQDKFWTLREKAFYKYLIQKADSVTYVQERYSSGVMHERDRQLVNGSQLCLAFLSQKTGGTAYTCDYAKRKKVELINLFQSFK